MMRLRSHPPYDDDISDATSDAPRPERTGVPLKAQKLLGEKGQLGFSLEESIIISGGRVHAGGVDAPFKAQKILGERAKVRDVRIQNSSHDDPASLWHATDAERQRSIGDSDTISHDPSEVMSASGNSPMPTHAPVAMRSSEDVRPASNGSTIPTGTSSPWHTRHHASNESLGRDYYNSPRPTLFMSQQTSKSSTADLAPRKAGIVTYDSSSETRLITPPSRRRFASRKGVPDRSIDKSAPRQEQQKKKGLRSLLPLSRQDLSSGRGGQHAQPSLSSSPGSSGSRGTNGHGLGRFKASQADVYDLRKTHVRRPPKGIKYWFDGFDISSEDEELERVELSNNDARAFLETAPMHEALTSVFSLYGATGRARTPPPYADPKLVPVRYSPAIYPRPGSRDQNRRKNSHESTTAESQSSAAADERKRSGESRLARSRLGAQSVLSLSSGSDGRVEPMPVNRDSVGTSTVIDARATCSDLDRVETATRDTPIPQAADDARMPRTVSQGSGARSNPFGDSSIHYNSTPRNVSRENESTLSGLSSNARRWHYGSNGLSYRSSNLQSPYERDGGESAGGETSSSVPTDASRLMAVTEEEMILLELMRQKRAAMQKHSFAEGYRLARRQGEKLRYNPSQDSTLDPSLLIVKRRPGSRMTSRGLSRTESLLREELEQRKRLSALRKEEVDKAFKIGRFLEMESPADHELSKLDKFLVPAPRTAGEIAGRPISGTEIEIDTQYGDNEGLEEGTRSQSDAEEASEDQQTPKESGAEHERNVMRTNAAHEGNTPPPSTTSPMQQITNQVRPGRTNGVASVTPNTESDLTTEIEGPIDEGPDTPVATTWARPTSLKHPRPQRQPLMMSFSPTDSQPRSPQTPLLNAEPPLVEMPSTAAKEIVSSKKPDGRYNTQEEEPNPLRSHPPDDFGLKVLRPTPARPTISTTVERKVTRAPSMASFTSAGEDVLAAWAELGGGNELRWKRDW